MIYADDILRGENGSYMIRRIGKVNLGDLEWTVQGTSYFYATVPGIKNNTTNVIKSGGPDFYTVPVDAAQHIQILMGSYTTASDFKTAMKDIYLEYELEDPMVYALNDVKNGIPLTIGDHDFRFHADPDGVIANVTGESWSDKTKENIVKSLKDPSTGEQLFPYGLLTAGSVSDEVTPTYAVKRVGCVNLSTLSWQSIDMYGPISYEASMSNYHYKQSGDNDTPCNLYHENYDNYSTNALITHAYYNAISLTGSTNQYTVWGRGANANDIPSGYLYYELETPVTITFNSNLQNNIPPLLSAPVNITINTLNI